METRKNFCLDLDGVIFDFNTAYAKLLTAKEDRLPTGWQDDVAILAPVWDWDTHHGYSEQIQREVWEESILPAKELFWESLPLLPRAKETIIQLDYLARKGHNIYFLTHRMGECAKLQTEKALYNAGISYPTVILCTPEDKPEVSCYLNSDIFVDDKLETIKKAVSFGLSSYLIDAPYNKSEQVGARAKDVLEVLEWNKLWKIVSSS